VSPDFAKQVGMFITYDLRQDAPQMNPPLTQPNSEDSSRKIPEQGQGRVGQESHQEPVIVQGAKEFDVRGKVIEHQVGEYELPSGKLVYGVRVKTAEGNVEIFEIPSNAENVQIHLGPVPEEYHHAVRSAA
jgi:hypothetical protein